VRRIFALVSILWLAWAAPAPAADPSSPGTQIVAGARLTALADKTAHALIANTDERELQISSKVPDQAVPLGALEITVQTATLNPNYVAIPLAIYVDKKLVRTVFAGYRIVTYVRTAVAQHDLTAGNLLGEGDVVMGRIPSYGRPPVEAASLIGRKVNISVQRGTPLYFDQTRINEIVLAGQPVVFIIHDGPVAVSADMVARTGGGLGQTVAVYNPVTNKALSGVVTGPGKVEFTLPGGVEVQ